MSSQRKAELYLLACTLVWGSTFVVVKGVLDSSSPYLFATIRFSAATVIIALIFPKKFRTINKRTIFNGLILGVLLYIGFMLQTVGLKTTTASKSAFFTGMLVVFTPIIQFLWERKLPTVGNIIGVILALIGLLLLTSPAGASFNYGDGITLICAFLFAVYIVYLDMVSADGNAFGLVFVQLAVTALLAAISTPVMEDPQITWSIGLIIAIAYLTIMATVVTTFVQTSVQGWTTPTRAAVIFTMEPVIAAITAYFFRGEILGLLGICGGAAIVTGLLISELSGESRILSRPVGAGAIDD